MNFEFSDKVKELQRLLQAFPDERIDPNEQRYRKEIEPNPWSPTKIIEELKPQAHAPGRMVHLESIANWELARGKKSAGTQAPN